MFEKKVVAVIVEGPSDENALGGILKEYFSFAEVQFKVVHGDITSDNSTNAGNVLKKINELIESIRAKYGYRWGDFFQIIHLTDTDGVFSKGCICKADVSSIQYYEDHIDAPDVDATERRNTHKAEVLSKLYSTGKIHGIRYRIYFNSCNLEHVLYDELRDFSDEEKEKLSDDFSDQYEGKVQEFIQFICGADIAVSGSYRETWNFIETDKNSLQRHSNMGLIFQDDAIKNIQRKVSSGKNGEAKP